MDILMNLVDFAVSWYAMFAFENQTFMGQNVLTLLFFKGSNAEVTYIAVHVQAVPVFVTWNVS